MTKTVRCICKNEPAAIERALRVIRVRGFFVKEMDTRISDGKVLATFNLESNRDIHTLVPQLEKLASIHSVAVQSNELTHTGATSMAI